MSKAAAHPEHTREQAYLERVHKAEERTREQRRRMPESAADRHAARALRKKALKLNAEPLDLEALCFGRIDLESDATLYLGRGAIRDEDNKLLVIDWRRPIAAPFYNATPRDPQGLALRRRFQLDQLRLLGIVDESFGRARAEQSALPQRVRDEAPEPPVPEEIQQAEELSPHLVDSILAELDRARGTTMADIVATIEARQYELISDSVEGILVIQGGPGTGKTSIALHRAAWLIYTHRDDLERSGVLVVGPNRAFMEYVAQVLPALGESSVVQLAIDRLPDLDEVRVRGAEPIAVARLKGDLRMADATRDAVRQRVRAQDGDVDVTVGRVRVTLPFAEISRVIAEAWSGRDTYAAARSSFRQLLVAAVTARMPAARGIFREGPDAGEVESAVTASGGLADRIWPTVTAPEVVRDLLSSRQRLAASVGFYGDDEREVLYRERGRFIRDEPWTAADIALLDEADVAINGPRSGYGYVLVDEAQDLTPMQLRMVLRRAAGGRATLVGDIAQATGPWRFRDWDELVDSSGNENPVRVAELGIGYRVPRQIMELAATLLPRIAPELLVPRAVRDGVDDPRLLEVSDAALLSTFVAEARERSEGERKVGLIAPASRIDAARAALADAELEVGDILTDGLSKELTLLTPAQAKGLEFDHAVVLDPAGIAGKEEDWAYAYVALTRATRTLSVIYSTEEPFSRRAAALPKPPSGAPEERAAAAAAPEVTQSQPIVAPPGGAVLGPRYTEALMQAKFLHSRQHRRGSGVPYIAHLQSVSSLVLEDGGGEDEAIAALLHDAVEDNTPDVLDRIADQFGREVALIVAGCTDPDAEVDVPWRELKAEHLRALESAGPGVRRVALAEKLDNARALLRDFRRFGDQLWDRMDVDRDDLLWYVTELADLFATERPGDMAWELRDTVDRLLDLVSAPDEELSGSAV